MNVVRPPLRAARALPARPACVPASRPRAPAKKAGIRYEAEVAAALTGLGLQHGRWFEYFDAGGRGYCQPDILLPWDGKILVLECKYTWTPVAQVQLDALYLPVVEKVTGRQAVGIVVCKRLLPEAGLARHSIEEALAMPAPLLHWIGQGVITARRLAA